MTATSRLTREQPFCHACIQLVDSVNDIGECSCCAERYAFWPPEWRPAICAPRKAVAGGCQPTALERRDDPRQGDTAMRGGCLTCGWLGPVRPGHYDEQGAIEDAHDHAFPGWRDLPIVPHVARLGNDQRESKQLAKLAEHVRLIYPTGWLERGGPIRTLRRPMGTRHVPGYAPTGLGYDMCAGVECEPAQLPQTEQMALFT